jgi:hypothetical protein
MFRSAMIPIRGQGWSGAETPFRSAEYSNFDSQKAIDHHVASFWNR